MEQEQLRFPVDEGLPHGHVPSFVDELLAELTHLARRSPEISQRSGVSVRVSVANLEVLRAAALKRAVRLGETSAAPRVSDLGAVIASTAGKIELESVGDESPEERIVERLITKALYTTFNRRLDVDDLEDVVLAFEGGLVIETGDAVGSEVLRALDARDPGPRRGRAPSDRRRWRRGRESPAVVASAVEFVLEGLHLQRRINKDRAARGGVYRR